MIAFRDKTYAKLLGAMLERVPNDVDKRESSLMSTALGPAAYALEDAYIDLERMQQGAHLQTAVGEDLDQCARDIGLSRYPAAAAVRLGVFNTDVPIGARFSTSEAEPVNYVASAKVGEGRFQLTCETAGSDGNRYSGPLVSITFIAGLTSAQLSDILIPGDDAEEDEALRGRCEEHLNAKPFGGNAAYYREFVKGLAGVGGVQVYPTWNGGGTVKLSITGADHMPASDTLIAEVQTAVDPVQNSGQGYGVAPIGAKVTVSAPETVTVDVAAAVTTAQGYSLEQVAPLIEAAVGDYILSLREGWDTPTVPGTTSYALVVYRARVTTAMLMVTGVVNVTGLALNGADSDIELAEAGVLQQLPILGAVTLSDGN